ncbi:DUF418 domain-containing protein [Paenibacillus sp. MDMC362]|uniref:DUF418 domain-containing protein n=1 Tax=Paenibacillus sp. MDMC362 TaxID=2977365 RepID=UPI000DC5CCA5|nr:DUF418 domain-containing protein [Paenibacillus sp. MDMC362]RAR44371.1 hypothetical protein DP091_08190 [Paenibacillus sp. MDMC362]
MHIEQQDTVAQHRPAIGKGRLHFVDQFRGFALLGLPFVNVLALWLIATPETAADFWLQRGLNFFVEARFYTIFTFLFGLGFYMFLSRSALSTGKPRLRLYIRRLVILVLIGFIHQQYQSGEALFHYAIVGLLAVPLYWAPRRINLLIGLAGFTIAAIMGVKLLTIPFLILLGLAAGQYRLLDAINKGLRLRSMRMIWISSLLGTILAIGAMWWVAPSEPMSPFLFKVEGETPSPTMEAAFTLAHIGIASGPLVSVFYLSSLLMLGRTRIGAKMLYPLQAYGRMALTNYIGQTVFLVGIQRLILDASPTTYVVSTLVSFGIVVFQILASNLWIRWFQYGPLEWLWRCGTYWAIVPIRKKAGDL